MDGGDLTGSGSGAPADRSGGPPARQQTLRDDLGSVAHPRRSGRLALTSSAGRDAFSARALNHPIRSLTVIYLLTRIAALGAIAIAAHWFQSPAGVGNLHPTVSDLLGLWDAQWYERIATGGYPQPLPVDPVSGRITYSAWAFFPLFPTLLRPLLALGLPFEAAALLLNFGLGWVAMVLIWRIFGLAVHAAPQFQRDRLALVAAALWCFYPATGILLVPYSEALAVVLIVAAIVLLLRRSYWAASGVLLLLGFTRAVAPAVGIVVLTHLVARWREEGRGMPFRGERLPVLALCASVAISAIAWPVTVGWLTGRPTAFFDVQAAWGQRPQEGPFVLWLVWAWAERGLFGLVLIVLIVAAYLSLVAGRHGRWMPLEVRAWALAYPLYLLAVVRPITSMWRFLLLDFPIAALLASVAMRTSTGGKIVAHWRRRLLPLVLPLVLGMVWWTVTFLTFVPWDDSPP